MKLKSAYLLIGVAILFYSCGGSESKTNDEITDMTIEKDTLAIGHLTYVELTDPLDEDQIVEGRAIFRQRCDNCHELDTAKLVGPGWTGITNRRSPEWIMNMILNVSVMLDQDSTAKHLLKENKVAMPDQNLAVDKARSVLEFMRKNDLDRLGVKDEGDRKKATSE